MPVGNPAPPRPRSLDLITSAITCSGVRLSAALRPAPRLMGANSTGPGFARLEPTSVLGNEVFGAPSPGHSAAATPSPLARIAATILLTSATARRTNGVPLTRAEGSRSAMPMSLVQEREYLPSRVVWP